MPPTKRPTKDRFWEKVDKTGDCWVWTGAVNEKGYGKFALGGSACRWVLAHRWSAMESGTEIPDDRILLHICDNPSCVRPDHLVVGTVAQNNDEKLRRWYKGNDLVTDVEAFRAAGMNVTEIAAMFGVSYSTLYRRLRKGA